jgi:hypothetical protein
VNLHAGERPTPTTYDGHVDRAAPPRTEAGERGGGTMAEGGAVAASEDCGEPASLSAQTAGSDRVDPAVDAMEPTDVDPLAGDAIRDAERTELPQRDDAVLGGRELRDGTCLRSRNVTFREVIHTVKRAGRAGFRPP